MRRLGFIVLVVFFAAATGFTATSSAGMTSASFQITTSVISGGGIPLASASYQANATLGQPSPVDGIIASPSFIVDSGFWATIISENRTKTMPWILLLLPGD